MDSLFPREIRSLRGAGELNPPPKYLIATIDNAQYPNYWVGIRFTLGPYTSLPAVLCGLSPFHAMYVK